ncbi:MAG TPA: glycosyltransferase family 39 protein [Chthoniobacterales bacterium]
MKHLPALLLVLVTIVRLWAAAVLPITPTEAYQWMCADRLDWAFFDAPGGTAALVHVGSLLPGNSPLGLRLAFPLLAALATFGIYRLGRAWFGSATALWAAVALNALPIFNTAAVHAGPEMPTLAFTALALWLLVRALERGLPWWILSGLSLAAAVQFSYASLALIPGIFLAITLTPRYRGQWRRPGLYFLVLFAAGGVAKALLWNQANHWPATALGTWRTEFTPQWTEILPALASSIGQVSLPAAAVAVFALVQIVRAARIHTRPRLLACLLAPFLLLWLRDIMHGDSATLPLLPVILLLATAATNLVLEAKRLHRIGAIALVLTAATIAFPFSRPGTPWNRVADAINPLFTEIQSEYPFPLFVIAPDPEATAALSYYLSRSPNGETREVFLRESQDLSNQFGLWPRYDDFVPVKKAPDEYFQELKAQNLYLGHSALYLTDEEPTDLPQTITSAFARVTPRATLSLPGNRKLRVYLCEDYQTMPL